MLPNGMDIAVLAVIGVFVFLGWKSGLVKMGIRLISFGLALVTAWALSPYLANFMKETAWYQRLSESVAKGTEPAAELPGSLQELGTMTGTAVAEYVTDLLISGISFFVILILARVLLFLIGKALNFMASLPVLGFFNRLGGIAMGLMEGLLVVWILMAALVVVPALRENKELRYSMEQSLVARSLYQHNFVLNTLMPETDETGQK